MILTYLLTYLGLLLLLNRSVYDHYHSTSNKLIIIYFSIMNILSACNVESMAFNDVILSSAINRFFNIFCRQSQV